MEWYLFIACPTIDCVFNWMGREILTQFGNTKPFQSLIGLNFESFSVENFSSKNLQLVYY